MSCKKVKECSCPKTECQNHKVCCQCVARHKNLDGLPYCLFEGENGDKSNEAYFKKLKKRFES